MLPYPLTPRELHIVKMIGRGRSDEEIAASLAATEAVVAEYIRTILLKLQLATRAEVALYAKREGLTGE